MSKMQKKTYVPDTQEVNRCVQYFRTGRWIEGHSYNIKHEVEHWQREENLPYMYISEAATIEAARIVGLPFKMLANGSAIFQDVLFS